MMNLNQYQLKTVTHPGLELREKLEELDLKPTLFAVQCDKPHKTISNILNEKSSITPDMSVKFESVLQIPARYWLKRQSNYDEAKARINRAETVKAAIPWARTFPYSDMAKRKWVQPTQKAAIKVVELFNFFRVSSHTAWENLYLNQKATASFRISLAHATSPHALSAWLRKGDMLAESIDAPAYNKSKLKASLPALKKVMAQQPDDFFQQTQKICLDAGLKVVYTPCLPKAPINGVARWTENNKVPLIQLSCRHKQNDIFWFSFFHEIGHILLHGNRRTDIFLENINYEAKRADKEQEADDFAIEWTFSLKQEEELLRQQDLSIPNILRYAEKFETHPALIIGRLQKKKRISWQAGRSCIVKIDLN